MVGMWEQGCSVERMKNMSKGWGNVKCWEAIFKNPFQVIPLLGS
jgi:hypothetical protein